MSKTLKKRKFLFDRGVQSYQMLSGNTDEIYICPLCKTGYEESALHARDLTLEHVPPQSVGGKIICLTCRTCNTAAGMKFDSAFPEHKKFQSMEKAFVAKNGTFSGRGRAHLGTSSVNADINIDNGQVTVRVLQELNKPEEFREHVQLWSTQQKTGSPKLSFRIETPFRFSWNTLQIAYVKSAYLAAFAQIGYSYALHENMDMVRRQIEDPSSMILPSDMIVRLPDADTPSPVASDR